jgi:hypothetical protein
MGFSRSWSLHQMSDSAGPGAPSSLSKPEYWHRRVVELGMRQLICAIAGLLVLLFIGISALAVVIAWKEHYETAGAFIDLMSLLAQLFAALVLVALLIIFFIARMGNSTGTPQR